MTKHLKVKRNILLNPGPATTTDSVKMALVKPDICPREKEFSKVVHEVVEKLTKIAGGNKNYKTVLLGGSGTSGMDCCVNSVVPPGKKIAVINNGAYGNRLVEIAKSYGIEVVEIKSSNSQDLDLGQVETILKNEPNVAVLAFVHHETTTGLLNPLEKTVKLAKKHNCVVIVDAISSFAGIPINVAKNDIDFLISTSNKCIQGMAGVAFIVAKESELGKLKNYPPRSYYLNLYKHYDNFYRTGETPFTPPVQIIYALLQAIKELEKEGGVKKRQARYKRNWDTLHEGLKKIGFNFLLKTDKQSRILLTIIEPENKNYSFQTMHDKLFKKGFTIYPGKVGEQKTFRLAIMGDLDTSDIKNFLKELRIVLTNMKVLLIK